MVCFRRCTRAILTSLCLLGARACAAPLPFTFVSGDLPWHTILTQKSLNIGSTLEAVIVSTDLEARFVIVSKIDDPTDGENLSRYANKIKASLRPSQQINAVEKEEEKLGFAGTDLKFDIAEARNGLRCELFTFVSENRRWGVVFLVNQAEAAKIPEPFAIFRALPPVPVGVVGMKPFTVKDDPLTGFPISFSVKPDRSGQHVEKLTVTVVPSESETEYAGVREGDEILSVNGKKTSDFAVGLGKNSELGRIFLNRVPGDEVVLEFASPGNKKTQTVVLHIARVGQLTPSWEHR